ncbi:MAG TPA: acyloxyacyl hydrolase [Pyrinomonadaceae bacterium]|nr:acyloxyacyl hydrolase [Pyrinomonadaceae bacterium]
MTRFFYTILILVCASAPVFAQSDDNPFLLKRGDNEFGFWGGFSPKATTIFEGLREDEADDRQFFIAAFRYGRTLAANNSLALQYTIDAVPVAVATGVIVSRTTSLTGVETFQRETAYGAGLTPIGLQLDFANGAKIHPYAHVNGGFLYFNKEVPIEDSGHFAFVGEAGGGVRIFTSERRAVNIGVRFHHISNGDRSGSNRGLNQFVIYAGFSVFK